MEKEVIRKLPKVYREKKSGKFCWAFVCKSESEVITVGGEEAGLWLVDEFRRLFTPVQTG